MGLPRDLTAFDLVIADFDGTIATLELDWARLKTDLTDRCRELTGCTRTFEPLDGTLYDVRERHGLAVFGDLVALIAEREAAGFRGFRTDVLDPLLDAGDRGCRLAICSANTGVAIRTILARAGLRQSFAVVVGKEDVKRGKPDPEGLVQVLAATGVPASRAVFVGDTDRDREAGFCARVETWIV